MLLSFLLLFFKIIIIWILIILQRWTISCPWVLLWTTRAKHSWGVATHLSLLTTLLFKSHLWSMEESLSTLVPEHLEHEVLSLTTWSIGTSLDIWFQTSKMLHPRIFTIPISDLETALSPKHGFFWWEMVYQDYHLGTRDHHFLLGWLLFLDLLNGQK